MGQIIKNPNVSTGPLAVPFACSLAPLAHSLAPPCLLRSRASQRLLISSLACLLCSLPCSWESGWLNDIFFCFFFLLWTIVSGVNSFDHYVGLSANKPLFPSTSQHFMRSQLNRFPVWLALFGEVVVCLLAGWLLICSFVCSIVHIFVSWCPCVVPCLYLCFTSCLDSLDSFSFCFCPWFFPIVHLSDWFGLSSLAGFLYY